MNDACKTLRKNILTLLSWVHIIKGCVDGPPVITQVRFKVEPLLRNTSEEPRMVVLGSIRIKINVR